MQKRPPRRRPDSSGEPLTIDAVSAGGVLVAGADGDYDVALVTPLHRRVWCLPKGTLEAGETAEAAALREVREETGLDAELVEKLDAITYWFFTPSRTRIHKTVHFYLMRAVGGDMGRHDHEIAEARFFPILEAPTVLAYQGERAVVEKAIAKLLPPAPALELG